MLVPLRIRKTVPSNEARRQSAAISRSSAGSAGCRRRGVSMARLFERREALPHARRASRHRRQIAASLLHRRRFHHGAAGERTRRQLRGVATRATRRLHVRTRVQLRPRRHGVERPLRPADASRLRVGRSAHAGERRRVEAALRPGRLVGRRHIRPPLLPRPSGRRRRYGVRRLVARATTPPTRRTGRQ